MSDSERSAADRAARLLDGHRQADLRRRTLAITFVAIFAVASILGASKLLKVRNNEDGGMAVPKHATANFSFKLTPALANGTKTGAKPRVTVSVYEDFLCEACGVFEQRSSNFLRGAVKNSRINLEFHPFTFLIGASTNRYAERAANAAACVADSKGVLAFLNFHDQLFAVQPKENTAGPSNEVLTAMATKAGAPRAAACIEDEKFGEWVEEAALKGRDRGITVAPAIIVNENVLQVTAENGKTKLPGPAELEQAIKASGG